MRLGQWETEAELGRGGMGVVYRARDGHGRAAAIKLLATPGDAELLVRFRREAQALRRLDHPAAVRIFDAGEEQGRPWLAMALVPGETLERRLAREGALDPRDAVSIAARVARAVEHAHARGVLHRDVKPANVLLRPDGEPVLTDFGLAALVVGEGADALTRSGQILGTPRFLAPEQARGAWRETGPATDVYGLGATLFSLLTGQPPFRHPELVAALQAIVSQPAPSPRSLRPGLDEGLCRIVERCLAKSPADRPHGAGELAALLEAWQPATRSPRAPLLAAGAIVLASAASLALAWPGGDAETAPPAAALPPPPGPDPAVSAVATAAPGEHLPGPAPVSPSPSAEVDRELWAHPADPQRWVEAVQIRRARGDLLGAARLLDLCPLDDPSVVAEREAMAEALVATAREAPPLRALDALDWSLLLSPSHAAFQEGIRMCRSLGDLEGAVLAAERYGARFRGSNPRLALAWNLVGGDHARLRAAIDELARYPDSRSQALQLLSEALRYEGRLEEAERAAREACRAAPEKVMPLLFLSVVLTDQDLRDEARRTLEEVMRRGDAGERDTARELLGGLEHCLDGPPSADPLARGPCTRGVLAAVDGQHELAWTSLGEALALDPECVAALVSRGRLLLELDRPAEALADAERAARALPGERGAWAVRSLRARALTALGHPEAATAAAEADAIEPPLPAAALERAQRQLGAGDPATAEEALRAALERDPFYGRAWASLSEVRGALGDHDGEVAAIFSALRCTPQDSRVRRRADRLAERLLPRGVTSLRAGEVAAARRDLEALALLQPRFAPGWVVCSEACEAAGDLPDALAAAERAIQLVPSGERGPLALRIGRLGREAVPFVTLLHAQRSVELGGRGRALLARVEVLLHMGWREEALAAGEEGVALAPEGAEAQLGLALALRAAGRPEEGQAAFQRALDLSGPGELGELVRRSWESWR